MWYPERKSKRSKTVSGRHIAKGYSKLAISASKFCSFLQLSIVKSAGRALNVTYFRNKKKIKLATSSDSIDNPIKWKPFEPLQFHDKCGDLNN